MARRKKPVGWTAKDRAAARASVRGKALAEVEARQLAAASFTLTLSLLRAAVDRDVADKVIDATLADLRKQEPSVPDAVALLQELRLRWTEPGGKGN